MKDDHSESLEKQRAVLFNVCTTRGVSEKTMHIVQAQVINLPSFFQQEADITHTCGCCSMHMHLIKISTCCPVAFGCF